MSNEDAMARSAIPFDDLLLRHVRPALLLLFAAVALILLIACANVVHLHLARADARRREVATQIALGASPARLVREFLVESAVLAVAGAALGVALAWGCIRLTLLVAPVNVIRLRGVELDLPVLSFAALLVMAVTLLTGLWPALQLARTPVRTVLAGDSRRHLRRSPRRARMRAFGMTFQSRITNSGMIFPSTPVMVTPSIAAAVGAMSSIDASPASRR